MQGINCLALQGMKYLILTTLCAVSVLAACSANSDKNPSATSPSPSASTASAPKSGAGVPVKLPAPAAKAPPTQEEINKKLVERFDAKHDGHVTAQEMLDVTVNNLLRFSSKKDRTLTSADFHTALGDKSGKDKDIEKIFSNIDKDQNKTLDERELAAFAWPSIQSMTAPASPAK